jgi:hypothetical protein
VDCYIPNFMKIKSIVLSLVLCTSRHSQTDIKTTFFYSRGTKTDLSTKNSNSKNLQENNTFSIYYCMGGESKKKNLRPWCIDYQKRPFIQLAIFSIIYREYLFLPSLIVKNSSYRLISCLMFDQKKYAAERCTK